MNVQGVSLKLFGLVLVCVCTATVVKGVNEANEPIVQFLIPKNHAQVPTDQPLEYMLEALSLPIAEGLGCIRVVLSQSHGGYVNRIEESLWDMSDLSGAYLVFRDFIPGPLEIIATYLDFDGNPLANCSSCEAKVDLTAVGERMTQHSAINFGETLEEEEMRLLMREMSSSSTASTATPLAPTQAPSALQEDQLVVSMMMPSAIEPNQSPVFFSLNVGLKTTTCSGTVLGLFLDQTLIMKVKLMEHSDAMAYTTSLTKLIEFSSAMSVGTHAIRVSVLQLGQCAHITGEWSSMFHVAAKRSNSSASLSPNSTSIHGEDRLHSIHVGHEAAPADEDTIIIYIRSEKEIAAALVMLWMLQSKATSQPLTAIVDPSLSEQRILFLHDQGIATVPIADDLLPLYHTANPQKKKTIAQIQIWNMHHLHQAVYLDLDVVIFNPIDYLFKIDAAFGIVDKDLIANSGVMVIHPNERVYADLLLLLQSNTFVVHPIVHYFHSHPAAVSLNTRFNYRPILGERAILLLGNRAPAITHLQGPHKPWEWVEDNYNLNVLTPIDYASWTFLQTWFAEWSAAAAKSLVDAYNHVYFSRYRVPSLDAIE